MNVARELIALLAFGTLSAGVTHAEDFPTLPDGTWYRVEIIIFERLGDISAGPEVLISHAPRAYPLDALSFTDDSGLAAAYTLDEETRAMPAFPTVTSTNGLTQPPAANHAAPRTAAETAQKAVADYVIGLQKRAYRFEPDASLLLAQQDNRLQRSSAYRVLFHRAWIQPVPDRDQSQPMLIQAGEQVGPVRRIEGVLGVTLGHYLHLNALLWYAPDPAPGRDSAPLANGSFPDRRAADEFDTNQTDPGYMELREQRRMRSGELHYLDHPKFGVLARIDPVQPPEALVAELARLAQPSEPQPPTPQPQTQPQTQ